MQMVCFTPDSEGADYGLKECTQPLEPVKQHVSVLTGFANENAIDSVPGDHARGTGSFLTCVPVRHTAGNDIYNGISMDQVAAQALGEQTPLPSVQIGIQPGGNTGDCTAGYSCAYTRNLAWADERTPLPNITNPAVLFDRMFGADDGLSPAARALRAQLRASVLDEVRDEAALLSTRLGRNDRLKLDQYLTAVREVELRSNALGGSCGGAERPPADVSYAEHVAVMTELMALGLECDITRVITFMLGPGGSNQTYDFLGVPAAHHQISHHQNDEKNIADLVTIANWEVAQFAALVERLAATSDGSGFVARQQLAVLQLRDRRRRPTLAHQLAGVAGWGRQRRPRHGGASPLRREPAYRRPVPMDVADDGRERAAVRRRRPHADQRARRRRLATPLGTRGGARYRGPPLGSGTPRVAVHDGPLEVFDRKQDVDVVGCTGTRSATSPGGANRSPRAGWPQTFRRPRRAA